MQAFQQLVRRIAVRAEVAMTGVLVLYAVWLVLAPAAGRPAGPPFLFVLLARGLAAVALVVVARQMWSSRLQQAWVFLAAGLLLWLVGEAARGLLWLAELGQEQIPSLADFLKLAGAASVAVGLTLFPAFGNEQFGRIRRLLDIAVMSVSIIALAWLTLVRPALSVGLAPAFQVAWVGAEISLDLLMMALAARLVLVNMGNPGGLVAGLLLGAFALTTGADLAYGYLVLSHDWRPGGLVELGWISASLLLVGAGMRHLKQPHPAEAAYANHWWARAGRRIDSLLPVASLYAVAGYTVVDAWLIRQIDWVGVAASVLLVLLFLVRQGAIAGQMEMRQFAALVNATTDMAFVCDPDGTLLLCNPAMRRRLNLPETLEAPASLLAFAADPGAMAGLLAEAVEAGWTGEVELASHGTDAIPVSLSLQPIIDERLAQPLLVATAYDLTDVKARETELQTTVAELDRARAELETLNQALERKVEARTHDLEAMVLDLEKLNQELKQLDQLKSDFITLVSHELRAPLTNIRTGVELVLDTGDSVTEDVHETLDLVRDETGRLSRFVETILDLSALEAGRFPLRMRPVPVESVSRAVIARIPRPSGADRIQAIFPADLPMVEADEQSLMSVLFHLIDNALKYAPSGAVELGGAAEDDGVRVWVSDHGPGIPEASREAVFDQFRRLDTRDSREVYGHGLGLHLCRRLVEAMGGWIRVDPGYAGGARLAFWLKQAVEDV